MSLVMPSPSHSASTGALSTSDSPSQQLNGSPKKRKRDEGSHTPQSLLFPMDSKFATAGLDQGAMLAAGMFDVQALRSVDAWLNDVNKQQAAAAANEDMVKTASDILRSFVEHKLSSGGNGGGDRSYEPASKASTGTQGGETMEAKVRQASTPTKSDCENSGGGAAECSECGKAFKCKTDLLRHIDNEHSVVAKIFKCDECPYETRHQSNLSVHRRTHTGERPYFCGACGQSYTQGHQLKTHIRSRHGANMAYYNMDKHGMGRGPSKSTFDLKLGLPPSHGKNDKINQLLAAAAASGRNLNTPASSSSQMPAFSCLGTVASDMRQPFLGMIPSHIGSLRPFLDSNLALSGNLLGSGANLFSHFFPFSAPPALIPMNDLPSQKTTLEPLSSLFSAVNGLNSCSVSFSGTTNSPMKFQPVNLEAKLSSQSDHLNSSFPSDEPRFATDSAIPNGHNESLYDVNHAAITHQECEASPSTQSEEQTMVTTEPQSSAYDKEFENGIDNATENSQGGEEDYDACVFVEPQDVSATPEPPPVCQHRQQLLRLRQNVLRMLNLLAPNIGLDKTVDLNTCQIDDLLHEVLFGNLEEPIAK